mmetsp:Transcript_14767/g.26491  ORF Transcript_14767/g.26491 Transcript_14767/m.26491 type:complete len:1228 (+) Transcript_14767:159-3842(+)
MTGKKVEQEETQSISSSFSGSGSSKSANQRIDSSSYSTSDSPRSTAQFSHGSDKGELAKKETENVNRLRFIVLAILTMVAVGVSVLVYFITKQTGEEEMESQFFSVSSRLVDAFVAIRTERIATLASLAIAAIAHGVDHSRDWPFVSLSFYQQRAYTAKLNSGALQVSIAPFVSNETRSAWEEYIVSDEAEVDWIEQSVAYQEEVGIDPFIKDYGQNFRNDRFHSIKRWYGESIDARAVPLLDKDQAMSYIPFWEMSPFLTYDDVNIDMLHDERGVYGKACIEEGAIIIGNMTQRPSGGIDSDNRITSTFAQLLSIEKGRKVDYEGDPMSHIFIPIFDSFESGRRARALLVGLFNWGILFRGIVPEAAAGIDLVLRNECQQSFTYRLYGEGEVLPVGEGDLHEPAFSEWEVQTPVLMSGETADGTRDGLPFGTSGCDYFMSIYPSQVFVEQYKSPIPAIVVSVVSFVFLFTIFLFLFYDRLVERRQSLVLRKAVQSTAIVSSLFPQNVRERLMKSTVDETGAASTFREKLRNSKDGGKASYFGADNNDDGDPIADLFPHCTVLFADIAGFTAWSSVRSPEQVFTLLQSVYQAFDRIAARRRVFKVETIGDSYVAVTGLPEPQKDHAIIMAKFARDCQEKMIEVTQALEVRLGPDTMELSMRFGLNSGQVTGGVLRGDRARFQLFGDTVNTAARMESTGMRGKIQLSQSTADLLIAAGKENWIRPREEVVSAKGKGKLQTYWLEISSARANQGISGKASVEESSMYGHEGSDSSDNKGKIQPFRSPEITSNKNNRLIDWMSEVLLDYVKQIVAKNKVAGLAEKIENISYKSSPDGICLDEVVECFNLYKIDESEKAKMREEYLTLQLDPKVVNQVRLYVRGISVLYDSNNPFHNFDHACHVTMSVHKLMKRVVSDGTQTSDEESLPPAEQELHDTYGILTSDPLTLFAIVFSALIHDVDHKGVSNMQLAKECPELATLYRNKSIAEQNSFDISWDLLMSESFSVLRQEIFKKQSDLLHFRQVVVNTVLATDIFDKEMGDMRKERWQRIFGKNSPSSYIDSVHLKNTRATIVLEHIIQASDVSHTMQHWHVYIKWNRRLFEEMRLAYKQGRMGADPAKFWYQGELNFFDNYIIPLAGKIGQCGVFGVSSDEYLNYALSNRAEWEMKGEAVVKEMIEATGGEDLEATTKSVEGTVKDSEETGGEEDPEATPKSVEGTGKDGEASTGGDPE